MSARKAADALRADAVNEAYRERQARRDAPRVGGDRRVQPRRAEEAARHYAEQATLSAALAWHRTAGAHPSARRRATRDLETAVARLEAEYARPLPGEEDAPS